MLEACLLKGDHRVGGLLLASYKGTISVAAVPGSAHRFRRHASLSGSLRLFEFQC